MAAAIFSFNTWQQMAVGLSDLRGIQYDAVIDFQGAVRSALLARWSGAPIAYGSEQPRENAASMFYTRNVLLPANGTHVVEQALALAQSVTASIVPQPQAQAEFPVDPDAETKVASLINNNNNNDKNGFAILNPGAGWGAKMWPAERYAKLPGNWQKMDYVRSSTTAPERNRSPLRWKPQARVRREAFPARSLN